MLLMAMDRASVRRMDRNGFLHVETSHISKANVCPYRGNEIPNWQALGLDADKTYRLYRDPEEMARAAGTFNNVPLLSEHMPVVPDQLPKHLIIGSTGTDAAFDGAFLDNSLVVWQGAAQRGISAKRKRELSCGYRYRADMTPGLTGDGFEFDGVMRDIVGNHVALVFQGRAGPDVVVGDEVMKLKSRTALMLSGALAAMVRPLLAQDAQVDLAPVLKDVNAQSFAMDGAPADLAAAVVALVTPHLAADQTIDADSLQTFISGIQPVALAEDAIADEAPAPAPKLAPKADPAIVAAPVAGLDEATVNQRIADAEARGAARAAAIEVAKADVKPLIGEVLGHDSAESIYRLALDGAPGVDAAALKDAPIPTLKAMVAMQVSAKAKPALAQDTKFTGTSKLAAIVPGLPPLLRG